MAEPLDVSLRVRLQYAGGEAGRAIADMERLRDKAAQLGATRGAAQLGTDLAKVAAPAEAAKRNVLDLAAAAAKLGATTGPKAVAADLDAISRATQPAKRDLIDLAAVGRRLGEIELGKNLRRDFQALQKLTGASRRDIIDLGQAADRLGNTAGVSRLEHGLEQVGRRADEARRKLDRLGGGHGGSRGGGAAAWEFGREALTSSGAGVALRYGLGGAAGAGMAVGAGAAAVAGAAAYATRRAISLETALAEVDKAVDDQTPEQRAALQRTISRISRQRGIKVEEVAGGVAQAGYAGRPTADLPRFAEFASMTGPAWGISVERAGDSLAKLGNIFHFDQQQLEQLANTVDYLGNKTAAREPDIADFLQKTGGTAQVFGLKADQTAAFGATMQAAGMQPEVASTAFNAMLQKLGAADKGDKGFKEALREMHVSARGLMAEIRQDPSRALVHFLEQLNKLPKEKQLGVAKELFGLEHSDEAMILAGQVETLVKNLGLLQDKARLGSVENSFKIFSATTQASLNRAGAELDAFARRIGKDFSPVVGAAADAVARIFGNMNDGAERAERALTILDKLKNGGSLSAEDQAAIDADPKLRGQVDAGVAWQRREKLLRGNEGPSVTPGKPEAFGPPMPDADDLAAASAKERNRQRMLQQIEEQRRLIQQGTGRGDLGHSHELKLDDLITRYKRTFGEDPAGLLPGADKRGDLGDTARRNMAAYNEELRAGVDRAIRISAEAGRQINANLAVSQAGYGLGKGGLSGRVISASFSEGSVPVGVPAFIRPGGGRMNIFPGSLPSGPVRDAARRYGGGAGRQPRAEGGGSSTYDTTLTPEARGLLDTIAGTESPGYDVRYGGARFQGYDDHPRQREVIRRGPNAGRTSDAAGRYQFLSRTWDSLKRRYGFKDFSPANQDKAAWALAQEDYHSRTRRSLADDLKAHEYRYLGRGLHGTWTSLPGGIEQGTSDGSFHRRMEANVERERMRNPTSPRFAEPERRRPRSGPAGGATPGFSGENHGQPPMSTVQNFYGNHDPRETARFAQLEQNREIRRTASRALHGIGRMT